MTSAESGADRVIRFVERLRVTAGGKAGELLRMRDWQRGIIRKIYDPVDDQGRRIVRTALITMPRKQGKSELAAALTLYHLIGDREINGQVYSAAADRHQAALVFNAAKSMVEADSGLQKRVNIINSTKRIVHYGSGSAYQALSADAKTKHGFNSSAIIYDELAQAPNRELYDVLTTSTAARVQPLTIIISTQSSDPNSVMSELVDYGRQVLAGTIVDPTFVPIIYAAPMDADPWDEKVWHACNPALGDFRSLEEMRTAAEQAKRIPAREASFRALYLNQPVDAESRFVSSADWQACGNPVDAEALRGRPCWAGLDLSSTTDLTALVLYFPDDDGAVLPFFYVPGEHLADRENRDKVPYRIWARDGHVIPTPGRVIDKRAVAFKLAELQSMYELQGVAFDRWRIKDFEKILADEGIDLPMVEHGQGFKEMGPSVDAFETAVLQGKIAHGNHPVLGWNCANAIVEIDPTGARKVTKAKSIGRVDGVVALVMAIGLHSRQPGPVVYIFDDSFAISA